LGLSRWGRLTFAVILALPVWAIGSVAGDLQRDCPGFLAGGSFSLRVFRDVDGLPENTIQSLSLDSRGILWAGTQAGAASFDGRRWWPVRLPDVALKDEFIRCVLGTSDGSIWLGTRSNGLYRFREGEWTWYREEFVAKGHGRINALLESRDPDGEMVLWVGTHGGGAARFAGEGWSWYTVEKGLPSDQVWGLGKTEAPDGRPVIWIGTAAGVARLDPGEGRFVQLDEYPRASVNSFVTTREAGSKRQVLWAGSYGGGLFRFEDGRWSRFGTREGLASEFLTCLAASTRPGGGVTIWAGTDGGGVARIEDGKIRNFGMEDGFPSNAVYSLLKTTAARGADALWIGTRNAGLVRLMEGKWRKVWPGNGGRAVPVLSLARSSPDGGCPEYWVGTDGAGLYHWAAGSWTRVPELGDATVQCLLVAHDGTVWAGTRTAGLVAVRGGRVRTFSQGSCGLVCDMIQAVAETRDEAGRWTLWIGTRQGLFTLRDGTIRETALEPWAGSPSVNVLLPVDDGRGSEALWIGIGGSLGYLDGGQWTFFEPGTGLFDGLIQCLMYEDAGAAGKRLWVGTDGAGLHVLDVDGPPRRLVALGGETLSDDVIFWMGLGEEGRVFVLTSRGVTRLAPRVPVPRSPADFEATGFNVDDGLPSNQGNPGAGLVGESGEILVGTAYGCSILDPSVVRLDRIPKKLSLRAFHGPGENEPLESGCRLSFDDNRVFFKAVLASLFRGWDTRYRTQLAGYDERPSRWKFSGRMEYQNLPPGAYTFRVWGRDFAGNVTGPVEIPFQIATAPWQTWWSRLLMLALLAGVIWAGVHLRIRSVRANERRLSSLVETRTRELAEANARLQELLQEEPLTGLANRRAFDETLLAEWRRARRTGQPLALILVDLDGFKEWNDTWGHPAGDVCLRKVAQILGDVAARVSDVAARIGGDEFAVVLPGTSLDGAVALALEIRRRVEGLGEEKRLPYSGPWPTVSCGVAVTCPDMENQLELLELADRCLYVAKGRGGNAVISEEDLGRDGPA